MSVASLQRIKHAARAALVRALSLLLPMPRRPELPVWSARPYRVLYLRYNRIGDMIMAIGIIRAIARSHPTITLDVVSSPANAAALEGFPYIRNIVVLERRHFRGWLRALSRVRRLGYDVVVDGMAAAPKPISALLMLAAGAPFRIGIAAKRTRLFTLPVAPRRATSHHIEYMAALAVPFGVEPASADLRPELSVTEGERSRAEREWQTAASIPDTVAPAPRLLVNISAGRPWRRWPDARFEAVVRSLRARHPTLAIAVISDPGEAASAQRVAEAGAGRAVRTPSVRDAFALVATADLVFTPDTSISHAAAAARTPAVVMLPRHIAHFAPYRAAGRNVFSDGEDVRSIEVEQVLEVLASALAELSATRAGAPA